MASHSLHSALILEPALMKRQALKRLLRRHGFDRVLEAETVNDALVLMRGEPVQLVLTAWSPPGMAGVPLLHALKRRPQDRPGRGNAPAIVLLDEGLPQQQVVAAVKAGVAGRLTLPAQAAQLARILGEIAEPAPRAGRSTQPAGAPPPHPGPLPPLTLDP